VAARAPDDEPVVTHPADGVAPADIDTVGGWDELFPEPDPADGDGSDFGEDDVEGPGTTDLAVLAPSERPGGQS